MTSVARRTVGAVLVALAAIGLAAASRAPWTAAPDDTALLRLSWRAPSEATRRCRPLTEEEKADLPVHMQVPEICETRAIPYRLHVRIDGVEAVSETIHGTGARDDRPIQVFREFPLSPGIHAVAIDFRPLGGSREHTREDPADGEEGEEGEDDDADEAGNDDEDGARAGVIALEYSETIRLGAREIALLTLDPARRSLVRVVGP